MFDRILLEEERVLVKSVFWFLKRVELDYHGGEKAYRYISLNLMNENRLDLLLYGLFGYYTLDAIFRSKREQDRLWIEFAGVA